MGSVRFICVIQNSELNIIIIIWFNLAIKMSSLISIKYNLKMVLKRLNVIYKSSWILSWRLING